MKKQTRKQKLKEYDVYVTYNASVTNEATITVKARNEKEAEEYVNKNMSDGKDFINNASWSEEVDELEDPEIQEITEVEYDD